MFKFGVDHELDDVLCNGRSGVGALTSAHTSGAERVPDLLLGPSPEGVDLHRVDRMRRRFGDLAICDVAPVRDPCSDRRPQRTRRALLQTLRLLRARLLHEGELLAFEVTCESGVDRAGVNGMCNDVP